MDKADIKNLSKTELEQALSGLGAEKYRSGQVYRWLYRTPVKSFDGMTDIPSGLRDKLKSAFRLTWPALLDKRVSLSDGTAKYLFKLEDGNTIETVFLPEDPRHTICLSSQVGCKFACAFCASAPFGFSRNLKASEILDQVISVKQFNPDKPITNLVFMGIGEPLDNYANVMRAVRVLNDKDAFGIGARRITISTCGIIPGIEKLAGENIQVELSVSLHSADDKIRSSILPINKKYPINDLIASCRDYIKKTGRIITFEYVMIGGVNSSADDAARLASLLRGIKCKVNAISYNKIKARDYREPSAEEAKAFIKILKAGGMTVTHRKSKGDDIDAGCGQLRISRF